MDGYKKYLASEVLSEGKLVFRPTPVFFLSYNHTHSTEHI